MKKILFFKKQKYALLLNEKAFTLIEALFALSIFTMIVFMMTPIFQIMLKNIDSHGSIQEMEWTVFCSQIKKEIRTSSHAEIVSEKLILTKDTDTVIYEKYGSNLRRRVNSTGHEIILQNVREFSFTLINNAVRVTVKDIWGNEYSCKAYSLINWGTPQ